LADQMRPAVRDPTMLIIGVVLLSAMPTGHAGFAEKPVMLGFTCTLAQDYRRLGWAGRSAEKPWT